jgi:hypothetical protein
MLERTATEVDMKGIESLGEKEVSVRLYRGLF